MSLFVTEIAHNVFWAILPMMIAFTVPADDRFGDGIERLLTFASKVRVSCITTMTTRGTVIVSKNPYRESPDLTFQGQYSRTI